MNPTPDSCKWRHADPLRRAAPHHATLLTCTDCDRAHGQGWVPHTPGRPIPRRNSIAATRLLAAAAPAAFHFSEPRFSEGDFDPQPKNGRRNAIERPKPALEQHVGEIRPPKDTGKRLLSSRFFGTHDIFSEIFRWRTRFADFDSEGSLRPGSPWPISAVHGSVVPAPAADGRRRHRRG
jgi:hypothetical protein